MIKIFSKISDQLFLALCVIVAYVPFLNFRPLRMAGDEKVYISQAIEMWRDGRWFVQTLAGEPNYFKGPLHYILIHLGLVFFGNNLIAAMWMNAAFALLAALAMYALGRKYWPENKSVALLLGLAAGLNVGVYSHAIVSQMEVELCAFYALAIAVLGLELDDFVFWIIAGVAGWSKSPIYSFLIGISGVIYWASIDGLKRRLRSRRAWLAALTGVAVCVAGYLPVLILDRENFFNIFFIRENVGKINNGQPWHYVLKPMIHFALPWTLVIAAAIVYLFQVKRRELSNRARKMMKLGLAMSLPSILLWCSWTYKGQNYNLPTMAGLLLFGWACFDGKIPRWTLRAVGVFALLTGFAALAVILHFWPLPGWWGMGWLVLAFVSIFAFAVVFILIKDIAQEARKIALGTVAFFVAFIAFIIPLGEREMDGMRLFMREHPGMMYYYYDIDPSIWSEWSILQLTLHHPFYVLHKPEQFKQALQSGHAIVMQNKESLDVTMNHWRSDKRFELGAAKYTQPQVTLWTRWLTKGKTPEGKSRFAEAWRRHDLHLLEREFFIFWIP